MSTKIQIDQIKRFLSAYPPEVAELGITEWRNPEPLIEDQILEGMATDTPLAQTYNELDQDAKEYVAEVSVKESALPFCKGKRLNLASVCPSCAQGKAGYKSKLFCPGMEELFTESFDEKLQQLKEAQKNGI